MSCTGKYECIGRTVQRRQCETLSRTGKEFLEIERHQYKKDEIGQRPIRPVPDYNTKTKYNIINDDSVSRPAGRPFLVETRPMTPALEVATAAPRFFVLIPAAGTGTRMGASRPKQYLEIQGKPVLQYVLEAFAACDGMERICVLAGQQDKWLDGFLKVWQDRMDRRVRFLRCGGQTRRETVINGLLALSGECAPKDWILVHDAARPGITPELVRRLIEEVGNGSDGGLLALPVVDTVKRLSGGRVETVPRDGLWLAQTPQMFPFAFLLDALRRHVQATDEASAVEAAGGRPKLVQGHVCNTKITRQDDLALVEMFLKATEKDRQGDEVK